MITSEAKSSRNSWGVRGVIATIALSVVLAIAIPGMLPARDSGEPIRVERIGSTLESLLDEPQVLDRSLPLDAAYLRSATETSSGAFLVAGSVVDYEDTDMGVVRIRLNTPPEELTTITYRHLDEDSFALTVDPK